MEILGQIQLNLDHLNSRFNSMDEHLDSMVTQHASMDRKVRLGAIIDELQADQSLAQLSKATQSPPRIDVLIASLYFCFFINVHGFLLC